MRVVVLDIGLAVVRLIEGLDLDGGTHPVLVEELRRRWPEVGLRDSDLDKGLNALLANDWLSQIPIAGSPLPGVALTARGREQFCARPYSLRGWVRRLRSEWVLAMAARRVSGRVRLRPRREPVSLTPLG